jgi:diaminopimelate epimerase
MSALVDKRRSTGPNIKAANGASDSLLFSHLEITTVLTRAQDQGACAAIVGFVVTAAAEAAVNVYLQQSWARLSLSEQDLSFCK